MLHDALPQTFTPEKLAVWFKENSIDQRKHTEEIELTPENKVELKEKITLSTSKIYELKDIAALFNQSLKKGTPFIADERKSEIHTIPPTKGLDALEENRRHADEILKKGFMEIETVIFGIPWKKKVIYFDVEGKEYFSEVMNPDQMSQFGNTLFEESSTKQIAKKFKESMHDLKKYGTVQITDSKGKVLFDNSEDDKPEEGSPASLFE